MSAPALPTAQWRERVLAERAERLAHRPAPADASTLARVCVCEAGGDLFGIPVEHIARVMPDVRPAPLANAAPALLGIIARGGGFSLIYDLAALASGAAGERVGEGHLILLRQTRPAAGVKVTRTLAVADIALLEGDEVAGLSTRPGITSYGRHGDRIVSIIDVHALIATSAGSAPGGS